MARHNAEYEELLPTRDSLDSDEQSPTGLEDEKQWRRERTTTASSSGGTRAAAASPLFLWVGALVLVIACTDLVALLYVGHLSRTVFQDKDFASHLEYASPYIGLKELYESGAVNKTEVDPITVRPRVSAQVFANDTDRLAPRGEHDYWHTRYGRMSPNERHLHVTSDIHTIVQFRAIDFGMEDCHLVFSLPPPDTPLEAGASFAMSPAARFDVFRLDAQKPIDVKTLSHRTRPPVLGRVAHAVEPRADGGETLIHRFPCAWSSLHAFAVACAQGTDCMLDVWSSHNTTYGVNLVQHQTV
ncbi:hypothetical protein GY45DRAFT_1329853 [Cubamyces sp. BRFM 1775]|nr:hypothetical protein GY45DRAFT_1329853 [Cubamyces sp. BRFM 1775]